MTVSPRDPQSAVVDENRRWTPDWYTWLKEFIADTDTTQIKADLDVLEANALLKNNNLSDVTNAATAFNNIKQTATLTATGVAELATAAEVIAGTDAVRIVTPATLNTTFGKGRFHVHRNGVAQTGATAAAFNRVNFTTEAVDAAGWFSANRFQPAEAGWFWIYLSVSLANFVSAETSQAVIQKNGTAVATGWLATDVTLWQGGMTAQTMVQFNGTSDFVEGFAWCPTGITSINGAVDRTFMGGWKVGV
jgi:hypothetical protein